MDESLAEDLSGIEQGETEDTELEPSLVEDEALGASDEGADEGLEVEGEGAGEPVQAATDDQPPPWFTKYRDEKEQEIYDLRQQLQRTTERTMQRRTPEPEFFKKPQEQWTVQEWHEFGQYETQRKIEQAQEDSEWRGRFSAEAMGGPQYSYGAMVDKYLFKNPDISGDPTSMAFVKQLNPQSRYMLALAHEMAQGFGGDLVKAAKAIRQGLRARTEAGKDIQKAVSSQSRKVALGLVKGKKTAVAQRPKDVWAMSDAQFAKL